MFSFIELDDLFEKLEEFKKSEMELIACTLMSPHQDFHAYLTKPEKRYGKNGYLIIHDDIMNYMLGEMYDVGTDIDVSTEQGRAEKRLVIGEALPYADDNFVNLSFSVSSMFSMVTIFIPYYITKRQYDCLLALNERLKRANIGAYACLRNYNPISGQEEDTEKVCIDRKDPKRHLSIALRYLKLNGRIVEYDLLFGEGCAKDKRVQPGEKTI